MCIRDRVKRVAGKHYDSNDFESMSAQTPGYISRAQLMEAAAKRGMGFSLRQNSSKKFGFDAYDPPDEKKGGDFDDDDYKEAK